MRQKNYYTFGMSIREVNVKDKQEIKRILHEQHLFHENLQSDVFD